MDICEFILFAKEKNYQLDSDELKIRLSKLETKYVTQKITDLYHISSYVKKFINPLKNFTVNNRIAKININNVSCNILFNEQYKPLKYKFLFNCYLNNNTVKIDIDIDNHDYDYPSLQNIVLEIKELIKEHNHIDLNSLLLKFENIQKDHISFQIKKTLCCGNKLPEEISNIKLCHQCENVICDKCEWFCYMCNNYHCTNCMAKSNICDLCISL